jgi:hypothetical protein
MSILTNYNAGYMKICHYREISDDAVLVMLSIITAWYEAIIGGVQMFKYKNYIQSRYFWY